MKTGVFTALLLLAAFGVLHAELPLNQLWSVEVDHPTALSEPWNDPEWGDYCVAVGDSNRAKIIRNGEIVWTSPELPGIVTALERFDYRTGAQLVVATQEILEEPIEDEHGSLIQRYGWLHRFRGLHLDSAASTRLLSDNNLIDLYWDETEVTHLQVNSTMLGDSAAPVHLDIVRDEWSDIRSGWSYSGFSAIVTDSIIGGGPSVGFVITRRILPQPNGAQRTFIMARESFRFDLIGLGAFECRLAVMNSDLAHIDGRSLFTVELPWDAPRRYPRQPAAMGMTVVPNGEGSPIIYAAYSDTTSPWLVKLDGDSLEEIDRLELPEELGECTLHHFHWRSGDLTGDELIGFDSDGEVVVINIPAFVVTQLDDMGEPHLGSLVENMDGDDARELVYLSDDRLVCYDVGALAAPGSEAFLPSATAILGCYPDPFNASATIRFSITAPAHTRIDLYDQSGRLARNVLDGDFPAGRHSARLDGGNLPAGVYLLRLEAAGRTTTAKVVLVR